ncbi:MAG: prolyl oligopeptidase family serine peptidase [FCB group bacterium]|nr:prolyl oligopeptidase family serine peptidase [FCB group bacterium]
MKKDFEYTCSDGELLRVTAYGENRKENARCIVYVHGFKGFKDWGFVPYIGEFLAAKGFFALTFNFSHNGIGDNLTEFTEDKKFAQNTFSREQRELSELIDAYRNGFFGPVNNPTVGLLGHSRGGGITLATTAQKKAIKAAVVWSSVARWNRYSHEAVENWRRKGHLSVINQRTGQVMRLNATLLEDMELNDDRLNIEKAVKNLRPPLLVIHGQDDEGVPVAEAQEIFSWANPDKSELLIVPDTGHTFGAKHPFEGSNDKLDLVLTKSAEFFDSNL